CILCVSLLGRRWRGGYVLSTREPVVGRKRDAPHVSSDFELESNLEKLSHSARPLHPYHAPQDGPGRKRRLGAGDLERHNRVFRNVVLRLVLTAVAVHHHRRGALFE